jgi:hypothetical protein
VDELEVVLEALEFACELRSGPTVRSSGTIMNASPWSETVLFPGVPDTKGNTRARTFLRVAIFFHARAKFT